MLAMDVNHNAGIQAARVIVGPLREHARSYRGSRYSLFLLGL
jgi:hypothetical protein